MVPATRNGASHQIWARCQLLHFWWLAPFAPAARRCPGWHHRHGASKQAVASHPALRLTEAEPVEGMTPGQQAPPGGSDLVVDTHPDFFLTFRFRGLGIKGARFVRAGVDWCAPVSIRARFSRFGILSPPVACTPD